MRAAVIGRLAVCLTLCLLDAAAPVQGQTAVREPAPTRVRGFAAASSGVTSNLEFDRDGDDAVAAVFSGGVRLDRGDWRLTYEVAKHSFSLDTRRSRVSQAVDVTYSRAVARRWRVSATGDLALNGSPDSRSPVRRTYTVAPRLIYRGRNGHRVQLFTVHQARQPTGDPRDNASRHYVGGEYRRVFGSRHFWAAGGRVEWNDGADDSNDARRTGGWLEYGHPIGRRNGLRARAEYRVRDFAARFTRTADGRMLRVDRRMTAGSAWTQRLAPGIEWRLDYEFEVNLSNDPRRTYAAHIAWSRVVVDFP